MSEPWRPTGAWTRRFREALDHAFDEVSIELLLSDYFSASFAKISPAGIGKTFAFRVHELIKQAQMEDWLPDLVAAARERRPKNAEIAGIADDLGLTIAGPRLDNPTGRPLEALIRDNARFIDPTAFAQKLPSLEGQVCWVAVPGGGGTGFLVGPDLVLTNQHVVAPLTTGAANWADVRCVFDHREPVDGMALSRKKTTEVALAGNWLVHSGPPSAFDSTPELGDAGPLETDSALVRLAEPVGELPLGGPSDDPEAEPRGWVTIGQPPPLAAGNQLFLLQHPMGQPLRLSVGAVTGFNTAGTRVRHDANSRGGSSGSPCFDADLQLVALHHAHDPSYPPKWNQAIPLGSLLKAWELAGVTVGEEG